jgi:beta-lactamase superfamily II metal-dependent hydrolase
MVFFATSDATREVFWNINKKGYKDFNREMIFGQIPHHGSSGNYYDTFWTLVKNKNISPYACISVGENPYGHPVKQFCQASIPEVMKFS